MSQLGTEHPTTILSQYGTKLICGAGISLRPISIGLSLLTIELV
jgi:hypothetical protein